MTTEFRLGDVRDELAKIPDASIDLIVTSPPFLALRSYLPADHPDKHREIGGEATPADFLDTLLELTAEFGRVLAPHGSLCVELGDTYAGSGGAGGDYHDGGFRDGQPVFGGSAKHQRTHKEGHAQPIPKSQRPARSGQRAPKNDQPDAIYGDGRDWDHERQHRAQKRNTAYPGWPLPKSLTGIPTLYPWSLAYGRNLLTGEPSPAGEWRIRNIIVWARPNPPPGALADKFRPATSYITVACRDRLRYFDLDGVRVPYSTDSHPRTKAGAGAQQRTAKTAPDGQRHTLDDLNNDGPGAPPLDWHDDYGDGDWLWQMPTRGYKGSHYATFPLTLPKRLIEAMCPQRVCTVCGKPSSRVREPLTLDSYRTSTRPQTIKAVELADLHGLTDAHIAAVRAFGTSDAGKAKVTNNGAGSNTDDVKLLAAEAQAALGGYFREFVQTTTATRLSGWSDCGHDAWRTGVVLDPFVGSGTTLDAALGAGRDAIGIDFDERNLDLARDRIGLFLS